MKVLLLIPPTNLDKSYGTLKSFSNPQPSIGVAYIAAVLKDHGYEVEVVDAYVNQYDLSKITEIIGHHSPDIIGISVLTPSADVVYEISRNIRVIFPYIKIVMGNMHASLFSNEILSNNYADFVVHREGEFIMLELVKIIENKGNLEAVKGISFKKNGVIVHNPLRPHIDDLDSLPFPAWDLLPMDKYSTDPRTEVMKGVVERQILATRGCPNQCTFCSSRTERSLGSRYRMRSPKNIVNEIEYMDRHFDVEVFAFVDLAFPLVKHHAMAVCQEIIDRGLHKKITWTSECRVKPIDLEILAKMKESGCVRINFGIESGNDAILKMLKKNFTTEEVKKTVKIAQDVGLEVDGMFMIGLPSETEETIRETIDFAIELNVRYAIFNLFVPYPGCELWDELLSQNKISFKSWSDFTSYPTYSGGVPVYVPDGLLKEKLMRLQSKAMRKYYFRPRFVLNELKNFKTDKIPHYIEGLRGLLSQK